MQFINNNIRRILIIYLWLVALHSLIVGINLILFSPELMSIFGYAKVNEPFFKVQAGVFHFVMVVIYLSAAYDPVKNRNMIYLAITAKLIATIFLIVYFIFADAILIVLLSGIADFLMAVILYYLLKIHERPERINE